MSQGIESTVWIAAPIPSKCFFSLQVADSEVYVVLELMLNFRL